MKLRDVRMKGFRERVSFSRVFDVIDSIAKPLEQECADIECVSGRVFSEDVISHVDVPYFDRSAMDGYAVISADTYGAGEYNPVELKLAGETLAGGCGGSIRKGEAFRVMTGAMMPSGADACVMAEYTEERDGFVLVRRPVVEGENVSRAGEDIRKGSVVFRKGRTAMPYDAGVLASIQAKDVRVYRRPRIGIIVTGSELAKTGEAPASGKIVDSNSHLLSALAEDSGASVSCKKLVRDDYDDMKKSIAGCEGDIIIVTGGTACGKEDYVPLVVDEIGELRVHGVAMRPAGAMGIGVAGGRPVFLLPGNPLAVCVAYDFFVRYAISLMQGSERGYATARGVLKRKVASDSGRTDIFRVKIENGAVEPIRAGGGAILSSMTRANGYLVVPENTEGYSEGDTVDVRLF